MSKKLFKWLSFPRRSVSSTKLARKWVFSSTPPRYAREWAKLHVVVQCPSKSILNQKHTLVVYEYTSSSVLCAKIPQMEIVTIGGINSNYPHANSVRRVLHRVFFSRKKIYHCELLPERSWSSLTEDYVSDTTLRCYGVIKFINHIAVVKEQRLRTSAINFRWLATRPWRTVYRRGTQLYSRVWTY